MWVVHSVIVCEMVCVRTEREVGFSHADIVSTVNFFEGQYLGYYGCDLPVPGDSSKEWRFERLMRLCS